MTDNSEAHHDVSHALAYPRRPRRGHHARLRRGVGGAWLAHQAPPSLNHSSCPTSFPRKRHGSRGNRGRIVLFPRVDQVKHRPTDQHPQRPGGRQDQARRQEAQHPRHLRRRRRLLERQRLQPRHDGLSHAQHRPHRQGGRDLHRPLRAAVLHRRTRGVHHRADRASAPACSRSACRARRKGCPRKTRRWPSCSSRRATRPVSSARTISATATSSCRPSTASTSSSATSTTSTPRTSRSIRTTRRTPSSRRSSARAA